MAHRKITSEERRRRLAARQGRGADVLSATRAMVALHSSDPLTPHLSLWARVPDYQTADLDAALCESRELWRMHAMRRTLWVVDQEEAAMFAAANAEVASKERRRVLKQLAAEDGQLDERWLDEAERRVMETLRDKGEASTQELGAAIPSLRTEITSGSGKWSRRTPLSSRLLVVMAMECRIARTRPDGTWRSSQYRWALADEWFGERPDVAAEHAASALLGRYIGAFGPVTMVDMRWWTGWTTSKTKRALGGLDVETVHTETDAYVLTGDEAPSDGPLAAAFLPGLDPTPMGWKERDWYIGDHTERLFDRNGNVGPTVWWGGRVIGGWAQQGASVVYRLLEDVGEEGRIAVEREAARLSDWLGDQSITPRFRTPLERELSG